METATVTGLAETSPERKTKMSTLTLDNISEILANTRDRGGAKRVISDFVASGELAIDLRAIPGNEAKKVESLYNSYSQNAKKMLAEAKAQGNSFPELKPVKTGEGDDETVVLINLDVHRAMAANAA
jgi:hypothetical protein